MMKLQLSVITLMAICTMTNISSTSKDHEVGGNINTENTEELLNLNPNPSQYKQGLQDQQDTFEKLIENSPLGEFDEELETREETLGQKNSDRKKVKKCIQWILETKALLSLENKEIFKFRKTPGFFNKVEVWKGKNLQLLFHIFEPNEPKCGVIHNHNHGFFFQNVSINIDSHYQVSLFAFMKEENIDDKNDDLIPSSCDREKNLVHIWSREPSSGILKKMKPKRGKLMKIYGHSYLPYTDPFFIEQNTLHQVTEGTGQIISIILREADYHGEQNVYWNFPELPPDQNFNVVTPPEEEQISKIKLLQKIQENYEENFGKKFQNT